jgi:hypothetical protein
MSVSKLHKIPPHCDQMYINSLYLSSTINRHSPAKLSAHDTQSILENRATYELAAPLYANEFAVSSGTPDITFFCASPLIVSHKFPTCLAPKPSKYAPNPATCGETIKVPEMAAIEPLFHVLRTLTPAARISVRTMSRHPVDEEGEENTNARTEARKVS